MAYSFSTQKVASFKFEASENSSALTINGIDGTQASADTIIGGIQGLLWIGNLHENYEPTDGVRTVKQNVNDNE